MAQTSTDARLLVTDGRHTKEILTVLENDLGARGVQAAAQRARRILELAVDPIAGPPEQPSDGLLYGLIQSGKTSIITVAAAMAADNAFQCIVVLTTDNDPLYDQTLERVRAGLRGLSVLGKREWRDPARFARQLRTPPFVVVCSKNGSMLQSLVDAFKNARAKGLSVLIIDDEADQASLNTFTSKRSGQVSRINRVITELRAYFPVNTYLQVTATPQALFLQRPDHRYRPSFSVISEPGDGYVGGDAFFGAGRQNLLRIVDLAEVNQLRATGTSGPTAKLPSGLRSALLTFLISASARVLERPKEGFAFLCHVSMSTRDHAYVVTLLDAFKEETINAFRNRDSARFTNLKRDLFVAYEDVRGTESRLASFETILETIEFYIKGANTKLVNAMSGDEISLDAVFNFFVGGNKLGRGVTIKNLLVSYYGRNPRTPNADTVLQHARMYGYRKADVGVTRLFLPQRLADHFSSIHQMETALRDLLEKYPNGCFEGVFISGAWEPTRRNVLDPTSLGYYVAGASYNPSYPLRDESVRKKTAWVDSYLADVADDSPYIETSVDRIVSLIQTCDADPQHSIQLWDPRSLKAALEMYVRMKGDRAYLLVRRGRKLTQPRRETQGILAGGEEALVPRDAPALFLFRQDVTWDGQAEVWWPQLRFADGNYVLAFGFDW